MISGAELYRLNRQATRRAREAGVKPWQVNRARLEAFKKGTVRTLFPFVGDRCPRGFVKVGDSLFCDTSGFGSESEPALTLRGLLAELDKYADCETANFWGIVLSGQFQAYVQRFAKRPSGEALRG